MTGRAADLAEQAWPDVDRPVVAVPVGSCEQHGPHLPVGTDTMIAVELSERLADRRPYVVVGPPITVAASGEHHGFPGTLSIGTEATATVLIELARSADWAAGLVYVNAHGGNADALRTAADVLRHEGRRTLVWAPTGSHDDLHAGHAETSVMLALRPELVDPDRAVAGPTPTVAQLRRRGVRAYSESGVMGDPARASARRGRKILDAWSDDLAAAVDQWHR